MAIKNIYVTGGAGYVGAVLVPKLLAKGFNVTVLDLLIYGASVLPSHPHLTVIEGDIRNLKLLKETIVGMDCVIHLACISNDPSFELNPKLGKSVNLDSFRPLVEVSKDLGVERFVYASSSSVYGIKDTKNVHEEMSLEPLTDYSLFKANCEEILKEYSSKKFTTVSLRPATVCGYSKRQRLDVVVNILTNLAYHKNEITVLGGSQLRPNIHILDMADAYLKVLEAPSELINGESFNVGFENLSVSDLAQMVRTIIGKKVNIIYQPTNDNRSYHVSSEKIKRVLNFKPKLTISDAILDLKSAFDSELLFNPLDNEMYYNIQRMKSFELE